MVIARSKVCEDEHFSLIVGVWVLRFNNDVEFVVVIRLLVFLSTLKVKPHEQCSKWVCFGDSNKADAEDDTTSGGGGGGGDEGGDGGDGGVAFSFAVVCDGWLWK